METQKLSGTRLGAGAEWLERFTECAGAQAFLSKGRIVDAGLSHRRLGEAARSKEDPGLVRRPGLFLVGSEILKDMQLQISRGYAVRARAVIDRASLVFDLRLFRSAKLRRLCTKCRAADLRIHPARMSCSSLLFACLADTCKRQKTTAENSARRSFDSRFFYAVFSSFSVATVVFEKEWSNHWERVRFPLPLRLQLQNSSLVDRSRLVVAVMWSRCEILARP